MSPQFLNDKLLCHGIDVSHFQTVDWEILEPQDFIFMKATDGLSFIDPKFADNWAVAKTFGIPRGCYHFHRPQDNALKQAQFYTQNLFKNNPVRDYLNDDDIQPIIDLEVTGGQTPEAIKISAKIWLNYVEQLTHRTPIIYSNLAFIQKIGFDKSFARYPLWLAADRENEPPCPPPWDHYDFWQYGQRVVKGVGEVDCDWFYGSPTDLKNFIQKSIIPPGGKSS